VVWSEQPQSLGHTDTPFVCTYITREITLFPSSYNFQSFVLIFMINKFIAIDKNILARYNIQLW
jgi:hypothetical protein